MEYLKQFTTHAQYQSYIKSSGAKFPNVSICDDITNEVHYNLTAPHEVGDIAYWNGGNIDFTPYSSWSSSLGTAIGVCFIPTSHASVWGDGKARFLAVYGVNADGSANTSSDGWLPWENNGQDVGLTKYEAVPTWDNTIGGSVGSNLDGYISSDRFTGTQNVIDRLTYYHGDTYIPSPYAADGSFYEDYRRVISNNNALSDFKGKANTRTMLSELFDARAAKACSLYQTSGTDKGDWYLPAMGELAYIMPRFNVINSALGVCGGVLVNGNHSYWSSTEASPWETYLVACQDSWVRPSSSDNFEYFRPVVAL